MESYVKSVFKLKVNNVKKSVEEKRFLSILLVVMLIVNGFITRSKADNVQIN